MPTASIIIPCYNSQQWISDAIHSALAQENVDVEVIVVDDGSTDDSLAKIQSFGDSIRVQAGPNKGACAARNIGVSMAKGQFIQFLDSDDLLHPHKVCRSLEVLGGRKNQLVFSLHDVTSLDPDVPAVQWNRRDDCNDPVAFMLRGDLPTPGPLHHKSAIEAIGGFREDLPCAQDRDFHIRMALSGVQFEMIPESLHTIRRRAGSIGTSNEARIHKYRGMIACETFKKLSDSGPVSEEWAVGCAAMLTHAARGLTMSDSKTAASYSKKALEFDRSGGRHLVYSNAARRVLPFLGLHTTERLVHFTQRIRHAISKNKVSEASD